MWADTILIVVISICTALLGEGKYRNFNRITPLITILQTYQPLLLLGLIWLLVYRTEKYQKLKIEVEKGSKKC